MAQTSSNPEQLARDAAMIDAFERRREGGAAADVPAEWQPEVEAWLRLQRRVRSEPLPEVAASVRAVVLGAAAEVAPTYAAARQPWWTRWLTPVPLMASLTAVALAVAVGVRLSPTQQAQAGVAAKLTSEVAQRTAMAEVIAAQAAAPAMMAPESGMVAADPGTPTVEGAPGSEERLAGGDGVERGGGDRRRRDANRMAAREPERVGVAALQPASEPGSGANAPSSETDLARAKAASQPAAVARVAVPRTIEAVPASLGPAETEAAAAAGAPAAERTSASQTVAELRELVDKAPSSTARLALLRKLVAAARTAGDDATLKWAEAQAAKLSGPKLHKQ